MIYGWHQPTISLCACHIKKCYKNRSWWPSLCLNHTALLARRTKIPRRLSEQGKQSKTQGNSKLHYVAVSYPAPCHLLLLGVAFQQQQGREWISRAWSEKVCYSNDMFSLLFQTYRCSAFRTWGRRLVLSQIIWGATSEVWNSPLSIYTPKGERVGKGTTPSDQTWGRCIYQLPSQAVGITRDSPVWWERLPCTELSSNTVLAFRQKGIRMGKFWKLDPVQHYRMSLMIYSDLQVRSIIVNKEEQMFPGFKSSPSKPNVKMRWATSQNWLSLCTD